MSEHVTLPSLMTLPGNFINGSMVKSIPSRMPKPDFFQLGGQRNRHTAIINSKLLVILSNTLLNTYHKQTVYETIPLHYARFIEV